MSMDLKSRLALLIDSALKSEAGASPLLVKTNAETDVPLVEFWERCDEGGELYNIVEIDGNLVLFPQDDPNNNDAEIIVYRKTILWSDVHLFANGESTNDRETVARAMLEYRKHDCITGFFLDAEETAEGGPNRDEIDFTGLDEAIADLNA